MPCPIGSYFRLEYVVKSAHLVYNLADFDIQKSIAAGQIKTVAAKHPFSQAVPFTAQCPLLPSVIAMHFAKHTPYASEQIWQAQRS